ncbi:hypothetical protein H072_453 [Dactylellina haptotyla CBS 200.50]|uniref:Aminoglycoside phosphotransferase domain-containing protein n=1 Tax=Dactylellina haptotyla (strain CBS 200.50) TaxID=1284197 RepID=S8ARR0_DACHA|nr:hypothetical protein H072_453 [Dactylellina haptotyla CBS 200.50]
MTHKRFERLAFRLHEPGISKSSGVERATVAPMSPIVEIVARTRGIYSPPTRVWKSLPSQDPHTTCIVLTVLRPICAAAATPNSATDNASVKLRPANDQMMTSLQSFINRRATSRTSAVVAPRAESPVKQQFVTNSSHIPLASTRVPSRNTNHSRAPPEIRDDSDDFKDSEILSLENQDGDGYDDGEDGLSERDENGEFLHDFNREEIGGRYLVSNIHDGNVANGHSYANGNANGRTEVFRWQNNVVPPGHVEDIQSDEESDGRVTPKFRIADEPPAPTERTRTPPARHDTDLASEQLQQEQFYTSLEFETPVDGLGPSATDGTEDARQQVIAGKGEQSWEEIDREYAQQTRETVPPVRFSVGGLFEVIKEMGVPLRGSERLTLYDTLSHYKLFSINSPPLPYQVLIPLAATNPSEPTKMLSEIATISFIRRACPTVPTPEIAYHNLDPSNAAKVPFLVIRALKGRPVRSLDGGVDAALKDRKRCAALLDSLARVQSQIMKAGKVSSLNIDRIGNIFFKSDAKRPKQNFIIGSFLAAEDDFGDNDPESSAPITDLPDLCLQVFQTAETSSLMMSAGNGKHKEIRTVKRRLAGLLGLLPAVPEQYAGLTLFHNSLGVGSVLVDPSTFAVTCILNFRDVYTVPIALTPVYPAELRPQNSEWTMWIGEAEGRAGVDKYWGLRSIYETRMAKYDARFAGDLWDDEELGSWLRIWEVVNGGVEQWIKKRGWIEGQLEQLRKL